MKKRKSSSALVSIKSIQLKNLRNNLIDYADLTRAVMNERDKNQKEHLDTLLYISNQLDDKASKLTSWLKEWEQGELPF